MIIIVKRDDVIRAYADWDAERLKLFHFNIDYATTGRAELIVFVEDSHIYVLKGSKWPYGKPMSAADLLKYIANHAA